MLKLTSRLAAAALLLSAAASPVLAQSASLGTVPIVTGPIANKPVAIAIDETNGFAYTANKESNTLSKINLASNVVVGTIAMPSGTCLEDVEMVISVVSGSHKHLWVHRSDNSLAVYEIDPSLTFAQITGTGLLTLPAGCTDMVVDDSVCRIFLCSPSAGQIAGFDDSASHGGFIASSSFAPVFLPGGSQPTRLTVADAPGVPNRLFIADRNTAGIIRTMNTSTGALSSGAFSLPNSPPHYIWDVAFNGGTASGTAAVLASAHSAMGDGIVMFDPASPTQLSSLDLNSQIGANKIEDIIAYSTNASDTTSRALVVRQNQFGVDGGVAVIATMASSTGTILNTRTFPVTVKLAVAGSGTAQGGYQNLAADPARERFYAVHEEPMHVHVFDGVTGAETSDPHPDIYEQNAVVAVDRTAAKLYVAERHNNIIGVYISTASPTTPVSPTGIVTLPSGLNGICVDSSVNKILFTSPSPNQYILDGATNAVTTVTLPGGAPLGEALCGVKGGLAYIAGSLANKFYAVNLTTSAVTAITIPAAAGEGIQGTAFDPTADRLYVGCADFAAPSAGAGNLFVIDTNPSSGTFNTVVNTFTISSATTPCDFASLAVDRTNGIVYALDAFGGGNPAASRVFRIQGSTGAVLGTTLIARSDIDHGPEAIGVNPSSSPVKVYVGVSANSTPTPFVRILNGSDLSLIADVTVGFTHLHFNSFGESLFNIDESTGRVYFGVSPSTPDPADPKVLTINSANAFETTLSAGSPSPCSNESDVQLAFNPAIGRLYAISDDNLDLFRFDGITPVTSPTLNQSVANGGLGVNTATGRVYAAHNSSVDVFGNPVTVGTLTHSIGGATPAAGNVGKNQADVVMAQFYLSTDSAEAVNLNTFTVFASGTAASSTAMSVSAVRLFDDANADGILNSGDVQLGSAASYTASGTATFSGAPLLAIPASSSKHLIVVHDFSASVILGQTFIVEMVGSSTNALGATSAMQVTDAGTFPVSGNPMTIAPRTSWTASLPGGTTSSAYRMIGVPLNTSGTTSSQLESNVLGSGAYDKTRMRFFVWDSLTQAYVEHGEPTYFDPSSSCGFWVILRNAQSVTWTGSSTAGSSFFSESLDPGWNLVHNPFDDAVSLSNLFISGGPSGSVALNSGSNLDTTQGGFFWNGSGYTFENGAAVPGQAYWIQNLTSGTISLFVPRPAFATKAGGVRAVSRASAPPPGVAPPPPPSAAPTTGGGSSGGGGGGGCFLAGSGPAAMPLAPFFLAGLAALATTIRRRR